MDKKPKERAGKEKKMQNWFDTAPDHRKNGSYRWEQRRAGRTSSAWAPPTWIIAARNV